MKNILLTGVGGQGTVLAAKILAQTALDRNCAVRSTETIGMAQRGGSVVSHVRLAGKGKSIASPLIPKGGADVIIAFEPGEALRTLDYLKQGGTLVVCKDPVTPVTLALSGKSYDGTAALEYLQGLSTGESASGVSPAGGTPRIGRLVAVDGKDACQQVGSTKALNVVLLGAACATGSLGIKPAQLEKALEQQVKPQFLDMNLKALEVGAIIGAGLV